MEQHSKELIRCNVEACPNYVRRYEGTTCGLLGQIEGYKLEACELFAAWNKRSQLDVDAIMESLDDFIQGCVDQDSYDDGYYDKAELRKILTKRGE